MVRKHRRVRAISLVPWWSVSVGSSSLVRSIIPARHSRPGRGLACSGFSLRQRASVLSARIPAGVADRAHLAHQAEADVEDGCCSPREREFRARRRDPDCVGAR